MNRITNEQREAIVRKAVAERDALLHIAGAAGPLGDSDVLVTTERDKFEAWYLRDHFNATTSAASLAWSAWQASKAGTVSIEEYRRVVARCCELGEKIAQRPSIVMGEAIENAHSAPCEAAAGTLVSSQSNEKNAASVGGASAQVQGDGK